VSDDYSVQESSMSSWPDQIRQSIMPQNRMSFRSGEIRILDSSGNVEHTIPFNEAGRKL
jgi:hypothetical protein